MSQPAIAPRPGVCLFSWIWFRLFDGLAVTGDASAKVEEGDDDGHDAGLFVADVAGITAVIMSRKEEIGEPEDQQGQIARGGAQQRGQRHRTGCRQQWHDRVSVEHLQAT